jgi:hypothetical protein
VFVIKRESGVSIYTYFGFDGKTVLMNMDDGTERVQHRDEMIKAVQHRRRRHRLRVQPPELHRRVLSLGLSPSCALEELPVLPA